MRSIAFLSEKGGVGKTTLAVNVAVALAKRGQRVLVIDADSQANTTAVLTKGQGASGGLSLYDVLLNEAEASEAIITTSTPCLDLIPADSNLADANVLLASELGRERRLRSAMATVEGYDVVVIDTSPQRSLVNVNVLNFVDEVYCPVDPGIFALAGLVKLQESIAGVRRHLDNPTLELAGLVVSRAQRDNLTRDTEAQLRQAFGGLVMKTTVPTSIKIGEAHARYTSVLDYAPDSPGAKAFDSLTAEILGHGASNRNGIVGSGTSQTDSPKPRKRRRAS